MWLYNLLLSLLIVAALAMLAGGVFGILERHKNDN